MSEQKPKVTVAFPAVRMKAARKICAEVLKNVVVKYDTVNVTCDLMGDPAPGRIVKQVIRCDQCNADATKEIKRRDPRPGRRAVSAWFCNEHYEYQMKVRSEHD